METKYNKVSKQIMELKDLISGPLVATIDADSMSTRRYLSYLYELAFDSYNPETGEVGNLRMLEFTYNVQDNGTQRQQRVSIPLMTLVPLPLLQVKEADFDFDIQIIDHLMEHDRCMLKIHHLKPLSQIIFPGKPLSRKSHSSHGMTFFTGMPLFPRNSTVTVFTLYRSPLRQNVLPRSLHRIISFRASPETITT